MAIRWIFFDIGDVLFDEDIQHLYYMHSILMTLRKHGVDVDWDTYRRRVIDLVRFQPDTAMQDAGREFAGAEAWKTLGHEARAEYDAMCAPRPYGVLLDGITDVLKELRKEYKLGIVANQHLPAVDALTEYGIQPLFDVTVISEVVNLAKPDPAIFMLSLERAACAPAEAIMVGDRADNDVGAAKRLGFHTIRFQRGIYYSLYDPRLPEEHADVVVRRLEDMVPAVHRIAGSVS